MTLHLRERPSPWLVVLLMVMVLAFALFTSVFVSNGDWLWGALALVTGAGVLRLAFLRLRMARGRQPKLDTSYAAPAQAPIPADPHPFSPRAFVTRARHMVGMRLRDGYVVIGQHAAGFVPTTQWRHLSVEIVLALIGSRVGLSKIEVDAVDSTSLSDELAAVTHRHDGFIMDEHWSWARHGKALTRNQHEDYLALNTPLPEAFSRQWPNAPMASAAQQRRTLIWIFAIAGAVVAVLAAAGAVAWHLTGDPDFLVAGFCFSGMIALAVIAGVILGRKQVRSEAARRQERSTKKKRS